MNARPFAATPGTVLAGAEGELVSLSITVEPRQLEALLDGLARLDFPINPQIYHQAAVVYVFADGRRQIEPVTMVEFPAYAGRLEQVRETLRSLGLPEDALACRPILEDLRADLPATAAPPGAPYLMAIRYREGGQAAGEPSASPC